MDSARRSGDRLLVFFPGALGDFLCALPSILALHRVHPGAALIVANPGPRELVEHGPFQTASLQRREVADLFATGPVRGSTRALFGGDGTAHSWTGYDDPHFAGRLRQVVGGAVHVHRFRGMAPGEHAVDYYARSAGVQPVPAAVWTTAADQAWADDWWAGHATDGRPLLAVHPGSGSPRKNWEGFADLAERWRRRGGAVVGLQGPAEHERATTPWNGAPVVGDAGLRQIAALLRRASVYVGNDSGISHLAAAVGTPSVVLFGPSDPATWAPRGPAVAVLAAPQPCAGCGPERLCTHRLDVATVLAAIERMKTSRPNGADAVRLASPLSLSTHIARMRRC